MHNGFNFLAGFGSDIPYDGQESFKQIDSMISQTNNNWIQIIPYYYQDNTSSTIIYPKYKPNETPTDSALISVINYANSKNLSVSLRPGLSCPNRGAIGKTFDSQQWAEWQSNYTAFITHYANIAKELSDKKVKMFSLGFELNYPAVSQTTYFSDLADKVRSIVGPNVKIRYDGGYYDFNCCQIKFWNNKNIDYIGCEGYFDIAGGETHPSVNQMIESWNKDYIPVLKNTSNYYNKPMIFGEYGYCSNDWANDAGDCNQHETELNMTAQVNAFTAYFESIYSTQSWFLGGFIWRWNTNGTESGVTDGGYSPNLKPAASTIKKNFS